MFVGELFLNEAHRRGTVRRLLPRRTSWAWVLRATHSCMILSWDAFDSPNSSPSWERFENFYLYKWYYFRLAFLDLQIFCMVAYSTDDQILFMLLFFLFVCILFSNETASIIYLFIPMAYASCILVRYLVTEETRKGHPPGTEYRTEYALLRVYSSVFHVGCGFQMTSFFD